MPRLVPYQASYLDAFIEWRNQPASVRHNPLKDMTRMEIALERELEGSDLEQFEFHENFRWFIELEDGAIVGTVSLRNINRQMNHAELGYGVDEAYYGQGIATAAVGLLIDMCFRQTPLRKLMAYVHDQNVASRRVMEKLGFTEEGLLREHFIINGVPENEVAYGLLKREWRASGSTG